MTRREFLTLAAAAAAAARGAAVAANPLGLPFGFQAWEIAPDMRKKMHVHASVDEADIGLVETAKRKAMPVWFTVDAYDELFQGTVEEVRLSSTTTQNVAWPITIVSSPKLCPQNVK